MKYEYVIKIKVKDVEEDFYFDSDEELTKKDIVDSIILMKRKHKHKHKQDNSSFDFLKNMFGFK